MIENEKVEELMLELEDKTEKTISVLEGEYTAIPRGACESSRAGQSGSGGLRRHE